MSSPSSHPTYAWFPRPCSQDAHETLVTWKVKPDSGLPSLSPVSRVTFSVQHGPPSPESHRKAEIEGGRGILGQEGVDLETPPEKGPYIPKRGYLGAVKGPASPAVL